MAQALNINMTITVDKFLLSNLCKTRDNIPHSRFMHPSSYVSHCKKCTVRTGVYAPSNVEVADER